MIPADITTRRSSIGVRLMRYPSTIDSLSPVWLKTNKLDPEKPDPLDLLPLLELFDEGPDSEMPGLVLPPEFDIPGPEPDDPFRSA